VLSSGLARAIQSLGPTHSTTTGLRHALASVNLASGQYAEAAARLDSVVAIERVSRGEHPQLVFALLRSGEARFLSGELSAAEMRFREALDMIARVSDDESVYRILAYQGLGNSARESQRHAEAADYYQRAEALAVRLLRRDHRYVRRLTRDHAILLLHEGKAARAVVLLDSTAAAERRVLTLPHPEHGRTLLLLGEALLAAGEANRGRANIREAIIQLAGLPQEHEYLRAAQRLAER
jgi:tetratricopeptide (TPR) repeat protein